MEQKVGYGVLVVYKRVWEAFVGVWRCVCGVKKGVRVCRGSEVL